MTGALATPLVGGLTAGGLGADVISGALGTLEGLVKPSAPNLSGVASPGVGAIGAPPVLPSAPPAPVTGGLSPNFSAGSAPVLGGSNSPDAVQKAVQLAIAQITGGGGGGGAPSTTNISSDIYGSGFN